jgi:hypothetical protein
MRHDRDHWALLAILPAQRAAAPEIVRKARRDGPVISRE